MANGKVSVSMQLKNRDGASANDVAWEISSAITQILMDDVDAVQVLKAVQENLSVTIDALKNRL